MIYGGFWVRLMAHNIDLMILLPVYYLLGFLIDTNKTLFLVCGCVTLLYEIGFTTSKWQGTPGKKMMHLQVTDKHQNKLSLGKAVFRTFTKALTMLTLFIGYAMIAFHPAKKGLHDRIVGTTVLFKKGF